MENLLNEANEYIRQHKMLVATRMETVLERPMQVASLKRRLGDTLFAASAYASTEDEAIVRAYLNWRNYWRKQGEGKRFLSTDLNRVSVGSPTYERLKADYETLLREHEWTKINSDSLVAQNEQFYIDLERAAIQLESTEAELRESERERVSQAARIAKFQDDLLDASYWRGFWANYVASLNSRSFWQRLRNHKPEF